MKSRLDNRGAERGFALIVTLSLMILLTAIAVGLLTLSSISLRASAGGEAQAMARANARMAMMLAIGQLQKSAGPDQRVTGGASLIEDPANPAWTGVWDTRNDGPPVWLVSGENPSPASQLAAADSALLASAFPGDPNSPVIRDLRASWVKTKNQKNDGRYAYWIGDEGTKVRVDLKADPGQGISDRERITWAQVPRQPGLARIGEDFADLGVSSAINQRLLISASSVGLATGDQDVPKKFFHDVTSGGMGLPVDVVGGGFKKDLSLVFDSSQRSNSAMMQDAIGATVGAKSGRNYPVNPSDNSKFFLAGEYFSAGNVGPNWGTLYNFAKLWENVSGNTTQMVASLPNISTDIKRNDWVPYTNHSGGPFARDQQHLSSHVQPVVSYLQFGLRLKSKPIPARLYRGVMRSDLMQLQLEIKPVIGIWNPYNVKIASARYWVDWGIYPWINLGINEANGAVVSRPSIWMREYWKYAPGNESLFRLSTPPVDLEPGEFRLFSVASQVSLNSGNTMTGSWNENGAYVVDLVYSAKDDAGRSKSQVGQDGDPIIAPNNAITWYGSVFAEDLQKNTTAPQFGLTDPGVTSSWFALKSGSNQNNLTNLQRVGDLWAREAAQVTLNNSSHWRVPEQVRSVGGPGARAKTLGDLQSSPMDMGAWAWFTRTASDAVGNQGSRSWIDSNARSLASSPKWDGTRLPSGNRLDGWLFNSEMLGGSFDGGDWAEDGGPANRALISAGGFPIPEPQGEMNDGRYQGYGGFTSGAGGKTHVALFDVPRAPLVSIGQFQHAALSRFGYEPSFVAGNSYANPRIPLGETSVAGFAGINSFQMVDISHAVNEVLWDRYFFSTIGADHVAGSSSLDAAFPFEELVVGEISLPNPRNRFMARSGDESLAEIVQRAGNKAPQAIASRVMIEGSFNVNSTSEAAWKAVLSSLADFEFPTVDIRTGEVSWNNRNGVRLPRFGHSLTEDGWQHGSDGGDEKFWQGFRSLSDPELDELAQQIVVEVKARGPFKSFADFVNRDPQGNPEQQRTGALQAAIDRTINAPLVGVVGDAAQAPEGGHFASAAINGESQSAGNAGYLLQGDLLQSLAPIMSARSDYFRIRTVGEAMDSTGKVIAKATCEAFVQRVPDYVDPADDPASGVADLTRSANRDFGRRFEIVSFRWLSDLEI